MILEAIQKVKLYQLLFLIDENLAEQKRRKNCPFCGSPLHSSNYLRKPRGGPEDIPEDFLIRHSFCCSEEGCRKRALPVSCRFWERKVYWGVVILVIVTLRQKRSKGFSAGKLIRLFVISRHTLKRWMIYFEKIFPSTNKWKGIKGRIGLEISRDVLPGKLVLFFIEQFESEEKGLIESLRLLLGGPEMF